MVVLPVRIELTTSPSPRGCLRRCDERHPAPVHLLATDLDQRPVLQCRVHPFLRAGLLPKIWDRSRPQMECGLEHGTDGGKQNPPVLSIAREDVASGLRTSHHDGTHWPLLCW